MPEEAELETNELRETLHELQEERVEREAEEKRDAWIRWIALTTAGLAVVAALASLQSGALVNEAVIAKQDATIFQGKASDEWAYYQAKGIKSLVSSSVADALLEMGKNGRVSSGMSGDARRYKTEQIDLSNKAKELEKKRDEAEEETNRLLARHHLFAYSVTLTQIAIALSAIAALTRRKYIWYLSLVAGLGGTGLFFRGL